MRRGLNIDLNSTEPLYFPFNRNHCFLTTHTRKRLRLPAATTLRAGAQTQHMRSSNYTTYHTTLSIYLRASMLVMCGRWIVYTSARASQSGSTLPTNRCVVVAVRHIFRLQTLRAREQAASSTHKTRRLLAHDFRARLSSTLAVVPTQRRHNREDSLRHASHRDV